MFKFKFITGTKQTNDLLKDQEKMTLVIIGKRKQDIVGQSDVIKKNLNSLPQEISDLLPTPEGENLTVWECSHISHNLPFSSSPLPLSPYFYHHLYEGLVAFGKQQKVGFIVVKLSLEDYAKTKETGSWPYIIQLFPQQDSDTHVYGVLPRKGHFYELYQDNWESWLKESPKKA